jgi:thiamine-monophosphate kinase
MTSLETLGEFGWIERISNIIPIQHENTIKAIGDDAAVINIPQDEQLLISTDTMVEGVHFDLSFHPVAHLGFKAITTAISDIYAMNGFAKQVLVSLAISSKVTVEFLDEFYRGVKIACKKYEVDLIGGDTTSTQRGIVINVTAIGTQKPRRIVYRSGAQENDLIVVTGDLGGAFMGLQILNREKAVFAQHPEAQPELGGYEYILQCQLKPECRLDVINQLDALDIIPTSMIDISDGLSSEALHLAKQSNKGMIIYEDKLPLDDLTRDTANMLGYDPTTVALNGGEDYELLFTVPQSAEEKLRNLPDFTIIGYVDSPVEGSNLISRGKNKYPLTAQGWNHFKE